MEEDYTHEPPQKLEDSSRKEILKLWPGNNPSPAFISYVNRSIYIFLAKWFQATFKGKKKKVMCFFLNCILGED